MPENAGAFRVAVVPLHIVVPLTMGAGGKESTVTITGTLGLVQPLDELSA